MDMFSTMDKRNSHSRNSKNRRDDSGLLKVSGKRNSNKSRILSKLKGTGKNISISSHKRFKKLYSDNLFDIKRKNSKRTSKKAISNKNRENKESSIMFSKFLRSMEMGESPQLSKNKSFGSNQKYKQPKWVTNPQILSVILNSGALLIQIFNQIEKGRDIYDLVKDYVEFSQNNLFNRLESVLMNGDGSSESTQFAKFLITGLKLERWIVMYFFFFSFNKSRLRKLR
jgi:hypothetical protein